MQRRQRNPDASDLLTLAAAAGVAWWLFKRQSAAVQVAPQQVQQIAAAAVASTYQNQFTDSGNLHCTFPQTLQGRDSILGCYDPGANGPLGSSWSKEFRAANPQMVLPDSYPVF